MIMVRILLIERMPPFTVRLSKVVGRSVDSDLDHEFAADGKPVGRIYAVRSLARAPQDLILRNSPHAPFVEPAVGIDNSAFAFF